MIRILICWDDHCTHCASPLYRGEEVIFDTDAGRGPYCTLVCARADALERWVDSDDSANRVTP